MQTVVHLLSGDESEQDTSLAIASNLVADESGRIDDVAVVIQASGIEVARAGGRADDEIQELLDEGVAFKACSNTLETVDFDEADLIDGIETVPEGAVEVTQLQTDGYAYVRP